MLTFAALTLFLSSATAISLLGIRLSDISIFLFFFIVVIVYYRNRKNGNEYENQKFTNKNTNTIIIFILSSILLSTISQWLYGSSSFISDGISNAIFVPLNIIMAFLLLPKIDLNDILKIIYKYCTITIYICLPLYFYQYFFGVISLIEIADDTDRYSALSLNPNQLALFILPIPFFIYVRYLLNNINLSMAVLQIAMVTLLNFYTFGKGLFTAWFIALLFIAIFGAYGKINRKFLYFKIISFTLFLPFIYYILTPVIVALYDGDARGSVEGQGDGRVDLWKNGLQSWIDAPFLGNGPGHYSGLVWAYEGMESHNLLIDWLSAYGVLGAIILITLFLNIMWQSVKLNAWIVLSLNVCLLTQSIFHFYGRQPVFWIWWVVGLAAAHKLVHIKDKKCVV